MSLPQVPMIRVFMGRVWVSGIEVRQAPVDPGVWYHVKDRVNPFGLTSEVIVTANPMRLARGLRRKLAREGTRGRRGAKPVPVATWGADDPRGC